MIVRTAARPGAVWTRRPLKAPGAGGPGTPRVASPDAGLVLPRGGA